MMNTDAAPRNPPPRNQCIFCPAPLDLRSHAADQPITARRYVLRPTGFGEAEAADLCEEFAQIGLAANDGLEAEMICFGHPTPRPLSATERLVLAQTDEAYLLEVRHGRVWMVAAGYRGAVHALERLRQWVALSAEACEALTLLDQPVLAVRGMNRDDTEDWSPVYWRATIDFARSQFLNLLGISIELLVAEWARGDLAAYEQRVDCFQRINADARRAGIRLVPMIYNVDHLLGQFLHFAGRDDLTEHFERRCIRYDSDEAWELAVNICVGALAGIEPEAVAQWASEMVHEFYGDRRVSESAQLEREAWFYRELIHRLRARLPAVTLLAILSQAVRDRVAVFTDALDGEPVEFVHYDGEWTYAADPPALTTRATRQSLATGVFWIAKPAWSRIGYQGLPYVQVRRVFNQCRETIRDGYRGIFPNASRWQTIPWNIQVGAACAWAGDRAPLADVIGAVLCQEGEDRARAVDVLALDALWTKLCLFDTPVLGFGDINLSAFRSVVYALVILVERAAREPTFAITTLEEVQLQTLWQGHALWFRVAGEQVAAWRLSVSEPRSVWSASVDVLAILLACYGNALAAAWVVNREFARDTAKGPWRAWRPLLRLHLERTAAAIKQLKAFRPLDGQLARISGEVFEDGGITYNFRESLDRLRESVVASLVALDEPDAFAALKSSPGIEGDWPREGLYTVLDWPL